MNFSLPKLSAVALLSLAAGFGASLWLNAEPEEPGTPKKYCKTAYKYPNGDLSAWKIRQQARAQQGEALDGPSEVAIMDCDDCATPCPKKADVSYDVVRIVEQTETPGKLIGAASDPEPCTSDCKTCIRVYTDNKGACK